MSKQRSNEEQVDQLETHDSTLVEFEHHVGREPRYDEIPEPLRRGGGHQTVSSGPVVEYL